MAFRGWPIGLSLVGVGMAGDRRQALGARVQAIAAEHPPDPLLGDPQPAPLLARQLGGDPPGAEARVPERERDHALLEVRPDLVGHPRAPALPDPQRLKPTAV